MVRRRRNLGSPFALLGRVQTLLEKPVKYFGDLSRHKHPASGHASRSSVESQREAKQIADAVHVGSGEYIDRIAPAQFHRGRSQRSHRLIQDRATTLTTTGQHDMVDPEIDR